MIWIVFKFLKDKQKLKVILSNQDLKNLNITFEEIYLGSVNTKKTIIKILSKAKDLTGFDLSGKILLIEVFETKENGCVIYFSPMSNKNLDNKSNNYILGTYSFEYLNLDYLIDSVIKLFETFGYKIFKSSLYIDKTSKKYFLTLVTIDPKSEDIIAFLKEFSTLRSTTKLFQIFIDEHYKAIIKNNAIEILYNNFKK
ncbi:MAG: adaptor protein MecA [Oscillospiraceae bacterium]|nr:adaptor protein MecA [Oscillospiraceae bacterium]